MNFSPETADFLWELSFNNERPWFTAHKDLFEKNVNGPFKELANKTFGELSEKFPLDGLSLHISRIYRDARRLYGRGPYKDHLWFSIKNRTNGYNGASFFFEINPRGYEYGMGFYCATVAEMDEFRKAVDANPSKFERMAETVEKMEEFSIQGPVYKRMKGDYGDTVNNWYNRKYVSVISYRDYDELLYGDELSHVLAEAFTKLMPMCNFLNQFGKEVL